MPLLSHERRVLEAAMSKEDAVRYAERWYEKRGRRFPRRFRLEGSRVGNSYFVSKRRAQDLRAQWGGEVVEVIPPPPPRMTHARRAAEDNLPPCPRCNAEQGKPCMRQGLARKPHKVRLKLPISISCDCEASHGS